MPAVLVFGDSNTHGTCPMVALGDVRRLGPGRRWPDVMAAELGARWQVVAEGQPGRTTVHDDPIEGVHRNGSRVLPALLESHAPLDLVVLMLGTNDLKMRFNVAAQDIALGLGVLAGQVARHAPGAAVLFAVPPPLRPAGCMAGIFSGAEARQRGLGEQVRAVADGFGGHVIELAPAIAVDPLDGVHYDAATHAALGGLMAGAVRRTLAGKEDRC